MSDGTARAFALFVACSGCAAADLESPKHADDTRAHPASARRVEGPPERAAPAKATTPCALLSFDIGVSGDGGVLLSYVAVPGQEGRVRDHVRSLVRRHNQRGLFESSLGSKLEPALSTVALPSATPDGMRVTLLPGSGNDTAELFANTELFAPELLPSDRELACAKTTPRVASYAPDGFS